MKKRMNKRLRGLGSDITRKKKESQRKEKVKSDEVGEGE